MILLDTTVLVYAVGVDHPLRIPCRRVVEAVTDGRVAATTTVEVIQEFAHVRARRRSRSDAASIARSFAELLDPLVQPDLDDLMRGLDLFERHERLGGFDAVLAATVLGSAHLTGLVSADDGFGSVPGLSHHDPATDDFLAGVGLDRPSA